VDLVHDHGASRRQHGAAGFGAEQDVERFRRGYHDVGRPPARAVALARRRIAGAHPGADVDVGQALSPQRRTDALQRRFEVALDVVGERLERRDVDDLGLVGQPAFEPLADQIVDRRHEGGQRLAGSGRRRDEDVAALLDGRPRLRLRGGRRGEVLREPAGDGWMKQ
jgi:hypothetical protein